MEEPEMLAERWFSLSTYLSLDKDDIELEVLFRRSSESSTALDSGI